MIITDFVSQMWLGAQCPNTAFCSWADGSALKPILACYTGYHWIVIKTVFAWCLVLSKRKSFVFGALSDEYVMFSLEREGRSVGWPINMYFDICSVLGTGRDYLFSKYS